MADSRSYREILEQLGRRWIWLSLIAGFLVLVAATGFLRRAERPAKADHAFAIPPVQGRLMVEVLNGTQKQGAARTATRMLRSHGVDVVFLGNADSASALTRRCASSPHDSGGDRHVSAGRCKRDPGR